MTIKNRLDRELLLLQARIESIEKIMLEKYRVKVLTLQARGADEAAVAEYLKSEAGQFEWAATVKEIKKAVANTISRASDLGYMVGFANGN
jgi:transcriptional regulator